MRHSTIPAGRSINLALAARGIRALELAGVMDRVRPLLIPMPGRMLHAIDGALTFVPYGQDEHEVIYSVSRPDLNRILIDAAERAGVDIRFRTAAVGADFATAAWCCATRRPADSRNARCNASSPPTARARCCAVRW